MSLNDTHIAAIRTGLLAITGLSCLVYAILAVSQNTPQPFWWFVPAALGILSSIGIFAAFAIAKPAARRMASDEMYVEMVHRAQRHAYWIALGLYPLFAVFTMGFGMGWDTAFAAMGMLTGAAYLLLLTYYEWRAS